MSEREWFELWASQQGWALDRNAVLPDRYAAFAVQHWWEDWQARARIAEQREAEMLEALCEARILIDNFGYALAARVSVGHAAGVRARMNETLAKIDRLVAERES